jgi:aminodeoxyfutalosine synthase
VSAARAAGLGAVRLTVARATGDDKIALLDRVRRCQDIAGGIARFAPLPATVPEDKPTTGYEDVRMVGLSRLALGHYRAAPVSIEVDWSLYGPKLAQVALTFGADHLDGVAATSDESLGRRRGTVEDVERNIRAAGFEPKEYRP